MKLRFASLSFPLFRLLLSIVLLFSFFASDSFAVTRKKIRERQRTYSARSVRQPSVTSLQAAAAGSTGSLDGKWGVYDAYAPAKMERLNTDQVLNLRRYYHLDFYYWRDTTKDLDQSIYTAENKGADPATLTTNGIKVISVLNPRVAGDKFAIPKYFRNDLNPASYATDSSYLADFLTKTSVGIWAKATLSDSNIAGVAYNSEHDLMPCLTLRSDNPNNCLQYRTLMGMSAYRNVYGLFLAARAFGKPFIVFVNPSPTKLSADGLTPSFYLLHSDVIQTWNFTRGAYDEHPGQHGTSLEAKVVYNNWRNALGAHYRNFPLFVITDHGRGELQPNKVQTDGVITSEAKDMPKKNQDIQVSHPYYQTGDNLMKNFTLLYAKPAYDCALLGICSTDRLVTLLNEASVPKGLKLLPGQKTELGNRQIYRAPSSTIADVQLNVQTLFNNAMNYYPN